MLESEYVTLPPYFRAPLPGSLPRPLRRTGPHPKCLRPSRCQPQRTVARHCRSLRIRLLRLSLPTAGRWRFRRQPETEIPERPHRIRFRYRRPPASPGDWNTQRPDLMLYEGTVWYKRDFDCTVQPGHRIFVWFGAANYRAMVFLNGVKIGEHEGGFTPFQFE